MEEKYGAYLRYSNFPLGLVWVNIHQLHMIHQVLILKIVQKK